MSLIIALEGIDGSGKTNIAKYLSARKKSICPKMTFLGFTSPEISTFKHVRYLGGKSKKLLDLGSKNSNKLIECTGYVINLILYLITQFNTKKYDVVLSDRDIWVTHLVYVGAVSMLLGKIFDHYLIKYAVYPQVLFYLKTDVQNALKRTEKRGFFQNHENEMCLEKINGKYDAVINRIKLHGFSEIIEIDTNDKSLDIVCSMIEKEIRSYLKKVHHI